MHNNLSRQAESPRWRGDVRLMGRLVGRLRSKGNLGTQHQLDTSLAAGEVAMLTTVLSC
uniref:Uncharacterized protein n=1 Tax=Arundo donax TaxID=35708 RepID=A0A0A9HEF4_ARUDO